VKLKFPGRETRLELIRYGVVGALTTGVNYGIYVLVLMAFPPEPSKFQLFVAAAAAWLVSVAFAYFANRRYVFKARAQGAAMLREAELFVAARLASLGLDAGFLLAAVEFFGMDEYAAKLAANVLVVIANYFAGRLVVFRKGPGGGQSGN